VHLQVKPSTKKLNENVLHPASTRDNKYEGQSNKEILIAKLDKYMPHHTSTRKQSNKLHSLMHVCKVCCKNVKM